MKKTMLKFFSAVFATIFTLTISACADFEKTKSYTNGQFTDIPETEWYASSVADAYEYGIMNGTTPTLFNPNGTLTVAEGVTIAARLHSIINDKSIPASGGEWYMQYVNYCIENGFLAKDKFDDFNRTIRRSEMAELLSMSTGELDSINTVTALPDVPRDAEYFDHVIKLYRAGILTGNDAYGTFAPESNLLRSEISAMSIRIADSTKRRAFTPVESPIRAYYDAYSIIDVENAGLGRNGLANGWNYDNRFELFASTGRDTNSITDSSDSTFGSLKRDFDPEYAGTLDLNMYIVAKSNNNGLYISFKNTQLEDVVSLEEIGGKWAIVGTTTTISDMDVSSAGNLDYTVSMRIDLDKNTASAVINNVAIGSAPIADSEVSRLELGVRAKGTGFIRLDQCYLNKNYVLYDRFIANKAQDGQKPALWDVSGDFALKYTQGTFYDHFSVKADSKAGTVSTATRSFDPVAGNVLFDINTLLPQKVDGASYSLTSAGEKVLTIKTENGKFMIGDVVLHDYTPNVWQELYVEADTRTQTALIKINGKNRAEIPFNASYFDGVSIAFAPETDGIMWFDDVEVTCLIDHPDYPSYPKVASDDNYNIGMNFCYLWRDSNSMEGWDAVSPFKEFDTYLGFYDEGLRETADWEIKWLAEHGVDFIHACWYSPQYVITEPIKQSRVSHAAIHDGYMNARYSDLVDFCIMWETGYKGCNSIEGFYTYMWPYWKEYYFSDPRYARLDNKAVFTIWGDGSRAADCLGGEAKLAEALQFMDTELKKMGYDGILVLFSTTSSFGSYDKISGYGVENATYGYHWGKLGQLGSHQISRNNELITASKAAGSHHIPTVSIGFNDVGRNENRSPIVSVSDHLAVCEDIKNILAKQNTGTWKDNTLFISTWNEYSEGTYIFPTESTGFDYLENVRKVFTTDTTDHSTVDVKPTKAQVDRVGHLYPPEHTPIRWLMFETKKEVGELFSIDPSKYDVIRSFNLESEFFANHNVTNVVQKNGVFSGTATNDDFSIRSVPFEIPSEQISVIHIRRKVNTATSEGQLYFITKEESTWDGKKMINFAGFETDDGYHDIYINVAASANWTGTITNIRIDPDTKITDFEITLVEFLGNKGALAAAENTATVMVNGNELSFTFDPEITDDGDVLAVGEARKGFYSSLCLYHEFNRFSGVLKLYNRANHEFIFTDGSDKVIVNGKEQPLGYTFTLRDGLPQFHLKKLVELVGWKYTEKDNVLYIQAATDEEYDAIINATPNHFEFNIDGNIEGFTCQNTSIRQQNGRLVGEVATTHPDPAVMKTVDFNAIDYNVCVVGMLYTPTLKKQTPQFFFHQGSGFVGSKCINGTFDLTDKKEGDIVEITFILTSNAEYTGRIKGIRFDPFGVYEKFEIDYIRFYNRDLGTTDSFEVVKEFDLTQSLSGYGYNLVSQKDILEITSTNNDPSITFDNVGLAADSAEYIHIRMAVSIPSSLQIYFSTNEAPSFSEKNSFKTNTRNSTEMLDYYISVKSNSAWSGTINSLRIDPATTNATSISIEKIELVNKK